jgi:hypothetical protein
MWRSGRQEDAGDRFMERPKPIRAEKDQLYIPSKSHRKAYMT